MKLKFNLITPLKKFAESVGTNLPEKVASKSAVQNTIQPKSCPAYFHPSFVHLKPKPIKALSKTLDEIVANNHQKIDLEQLKNLISSAIDEALNNKSIQKFNGMNSITCILNKKYAISFTPNVDVNSEKFIVTGKNKFSNLDTWYGNTILRSKNISIMRNANPNGEFFVLGAPTTHTGAMSEAYYKKNRHAQRLAALPQSAYDKLALDMRELNKLQTPKNSYGFDYYNPNNFLINDEEIRVVDKINVQKAGSVYNLNNLPKILLTFIIKMGIHVNAETIDKTLLPARKEIFQKCVTASEKARLPIIDSFAAEKDTLKSVFSVLGVKTTPEQFGAKLTELRGENLTVKERLDAVKKYLDNLS